MTYKKPAARNLPQYCETGCRLLFYGGYRTRTCDITPVKGALSQLS